jgi:hypothetical protein
VAIENSVHRFISGLFYNVHLLETALRTNSEDAANGAVNFLNWGCADCSKNLRTPLFNKYGTLPVSNEPNFTRIHLAGQYL